MVDFPDPFGLEEPGDDTGLDLEREPVDGPLVAEVLRQVAYLDHPATVTSHRRRHLNGS